MLRWKREVPRPSRRGRLTGYFAGVADPARRSSLEVHRRYAMLRSVASDPTRSWVRVVDESGEDYLYPRRFFRAV